MILAALALAGCLDEARQPSPTGSAAMEPGTPTSIWAGLMERTPHAYTTPLPEPLRTVLDGTYAKVDPSPPQWWACRRCADYRPAGGVWRLHLDKGIMRIYNEIIAWRSIASFSLEGDRLTIFNDTVCPDDVGDYSWKVEDGSLALEVIEDPCSFGLRGENLSLQPWLSCLPPNDMVAASDHWHKPEGCEPDLRPEPFILSGDPELKVEAHGGIATGFDVPPDLVVDANVENRPAPEGVRIAESEDAIPYGRNLVLWKEGDWVEATTYRPFSAMGVQFHGDHMIGWARVLFDGEEAWVGDTSALWSRFGRHGGYVEISGFAEGEHTLRVECMAIDDHPVTIAYFGFSHDEQVKIKE